MYCHGLFWLHMWISYWWEPPMSSPTSVPFLFPPISSPTSAPFLASKPNSVTLQTTTTTTTQPSNSVSPTPFPNYFPSNNPSTEPSFLPIISFPTNSPTKTPSRKPTIPSKILIFSIWVFGQEDNVEICFYPDKLFFKWCLQTTVLRKIWLNTLKFK